MKMVFDSLEEKEEFIKRMALLIICPGELGLREINECTKGIEIISGCDITCEVCWMQALKAEVKKK